jgi:hypothetical protein
MSGSGLQIHTFPWRKVSRFYVAGGMDFYGIWLTASQSIRLMNGLFHMLAFVVQPTRSEEGNNEK